MFRFYAEKRKKASTNIMVYLVDDDSWNEYTLTYRNKPAESKLIASLTIDTFPKIVELDITDVVKQELSGDKQLSICISSVDNTLVKYRSKEYQKEDTQPQLIITSQ
jgi:ssRNA-specific RNase YbeY (16S rRNA maturation enzyme)